MQNSGKEVETSQRHQSPCEPAMQGACKRVEGNPECINHNKEHKLHHGEERQESFLPCAQQRSTRVLDVVCIDVCGPLSVPSLAKNKYILFFLDDFPRCVVCLLKEESETVEMFRRYIAMKQQISEETCCSSRQQWR